VLRQSDQLQLSAYFLAKKGNSVSSQSMKASPTEDFDYPQNTLRRTSIVCLPASGAL